MFARVRRSGVIVFSLVLCGTGTLLTPPVRTASLRGLGATLVAEDPVEPADAIIVTVDAGAAGLLEAADLVHAGVAQRVAFFVDPPTPALRELRRRGVAEEQPAEKTARQLRELGVESIEHVPGRIAGSEDEAAVLAAWCDQTGVRSVVVVSGADHSRRLRRMFHRAMRGHAATVSIRIARYSQFNPDRWWQSRLGLRAGIVELEKLLLDVTRHPLS